MRDVIADRLWTGNAHEARDLELIARLRLRAIVDLAIEERPAIMPREVGYFRCPVDDSDSAAPEMIELAIKTSATLIKLNVPTLIACSAGMSRSPLITSAALAICRYQGIERVIEELSRNGPIDPSPGLLKSIKAVMKRLVG